MQEWKQFLAEQEDAFSKETVDRWLRSLHVLRFDACNLYLQAKDSFQALWFDEHIRPKLTHFVNGNKHRIKVHVDVSGQKAKVKNQKPKEVVAPYQITFDELDPSFSFDAFIETEKNLVTTSVLQESVSKLLQRKLQALSTFSEATQDLPAKELLNPIFLYGPTGSGKTHLLQSVCHKLVRVGYKAVYTRAETFTDHVVKAIRAGNMTPFRENYRTADILLVDDVQHFGKKHATQEEFFHTFNALHTEGKLILLAANALPQNLEQMEPRLISRFEWGIVLPLVALEKKEKLQLIEKKAQFFSYPISSRTAEFLAESFPSSPKACVRALEALIFRSHMQQKSKTVLQPALAKEMLKDLLEDEQKKLITPHQIIQAVALQYGMLTEDVTGKSQNRESVTARQLAMYLCRELLKLPFMKIGDLFHRDHSTVMSSIKQVQVQLTTPGSDLQATSQTILAHLKPR